MRNYYCAPGLPYILNYTTPSQLIKADISTYFLRSPLVVESKLLGYRTYKKEWLLIE